MEYGKTYGVHVERFRIVGFLDGGYRNFIAMDWFIKKTQRNDRRMNAIYQEGGRNTGDEFMDAEVAEMKRRAARIRNHADEFAKTPEGRELAHRMMFATNLLKTLKAKKMTHMIKDGSPYQDAVMASFFGVSRVGRYWALTE